MAGVQRIECVEGDITRETVDAVVNAANEQLVGGSGVNGAIQRAAGPGLLAECAERYPGGCPTGEARITGGHDLPARHVIHTVGPVYHGGTRGEPELLASCYRNSIALAAEHGLRTVSFPAISTGVFGYPPAEAARIAIDALAAALDAHPQVESVRMVLFGADMHALFAAALAGP